jgi:DNA-binding MarR family transcriptional regulator
MHRIARKVTGPRGIRIDLDQRAFYRLSILAVQINRCISGMFVEAFGRPANRWKVLTVIGRFAPLSPTAVTLHTSLEPDAVARLLNDLVERGLVLRRQEKNDRRRAILSLSAKGQRVFEQLEMKISQLEMEFLSVLDHDEREALYETLAKLQERAQMVFAIKKPWRQLLADEHPVKKASMR